MKFLIDMPLSPELAAWLVQQGHDAVHAEGPGLILFRGGNYSQQEAVDRLRRALETIPAQEWPHCIVVIEKGRIRRRRLPVEPNR